MRRVRDAIPSHSLQPPSCKTGQSGHPSLLVDMCFRRQQQWHLVYALGMPIGSLCGSEPVCVCAFASLRPCLFLRMAMTIPLWFCLDAFLSVRCLSCGGAYTFNLARTVLARDLQQASRNTTKRRLYSNSDCVLVGKREKKKKRKKKRNERNPCVCANVPLQLLVPGEMISPCGNQGQQNKVPLKRYMMPACRYLARCHGTATAVSSSHQLHQVPNER
ncbi:hypothetical protein V8C35DRAFT_184333 [Trichoderma chlorosporum]